MEGTFTFKFIIYFELIFTQYIRLNQCFLFSCGYPTLQPDLLKTNRGGQKQVYSCVYGEKMEVMVIK